MQVNAGCLADTAGRIHHACDFCRRGSHVAAQVVDGICNVDNLVMGLTKSGFPLCHIIGRRFCINIPRSSQTGRIVQVAFFSGLLVIQKDLLIALTGLSQRCGDLRHLVPFDWDLRGHLEDCVLHGGTLFRVNAAVIVHDAANILDCICRLGLVFLCHGGCLFNHDSGRSCQRRHDSKPSLSDYAQSVCYRAAQRLCSRQCARQITGQPLRLLYCSYKGWVHLAHDADAEV